MMIESMLTTIDNPHSPFDEWDEWYAYDTRMGYNTPTYLARVCITSPNLSEYDQDQAIEMAIDEILEYNVIGLYTKVTREVPNREDTKTVT